MISSIALYPKSIESEKLKELLSRFSNSMKSANGLKSMKVSDGDLMSPGGPPAYSKVVETTWETLGDLMAWVENQTPEMQADKDFLLENGGILLFYETQDM
jgi:hypothetical protein